MQPLKHKTHQHQRENDTIHYFIIITKTKDNAQSFKLI